MARAALLLLALSLALLAPACAQAHSLFEATKRPLPQNLPWYLVAAWGDNRPAATSGPLSRAYPQVFVDILNELSAVYPMAVVGGGDFVSFGTEDQYAAFYSLASQARLENFLPVVGNHDVAYGDASWGLYTKYVGPTSLVFDGIPGWRIAALNGEGGVSEWSSGIAAAASGLGKRALILAFHRPLYPYVNHNLQDDDPDKASELEAAMLNGTLSPKIVLQSHWHGFAANLTNSTSWFIVGGGGAPLYSCPSGASFPCASKYSYLLLVLFSNQTFRAYPLAAGPGAGNVTVIPEGAKYVVVNTKRDVFGNPTEVPVRLVWLAGDYAVYLVAFAPPNSTTVAAIDPATMKLETNLTGGYVYVVARGSSNATVLDASSGSADLSGLGLQAPSAVPIPVVSQATQTTTGAAKPTTAATTTSTQAARTSAATTTTTGSTSATTTSSATTTQAATASTPTATAAQTGAPQAAPAALPMLAIAVAAAALIVSALILVKRRA